MARSMFGWDLPPGCTQYHIDEARGANGIECARCGARSGEEQNICPTCGAELFWECAACGAASNADSQSCSCCGNRRGDSE